MFFTRVCHSIHEVGLPTGGSAYGGSTNWGGLSTGGVWPTEGSPYEGVYIQGSV